MKGPLSYRFPAIRLAQRNLRRAKIRSVLAGMGIVIGVVAIACLGMFGLSLQYEFEQSVGQFGNQVLVTPADSNDTISDGDIRRIQSRVEFEGSMVPIKQDVRQVSFGDGSSQRRTVTGVRRPSTLYQLREGEIPKPFRSGVLIGSEIAEEFDLKPRSTITIDGTSVRVKAVLESTDGFGFIQAGDSIVLPAREVDQRNYDSIIILTEDTRSANETAIAVRESLNSREDRVEVEDLSTLADSFDDFFSTMNAFLVGIGSISLLVAGTSILNVMLMNVTERREEIGVMRALGIQKTNVLKIILTESVLIGVISGFIGACLSLVFGLIIYGLILNDPFEVFRYSNFLYITTAALFGCLVSTVSGLYPAWRAAEENPIDAIRD